MVINPFKLERYFAQYEFNIKYLLSPSDCESLSMEELLQMASTESLDLWKNLKLGYTESAGHPILRSEVSSLYEAIKPERVLIAVPEEAIFITMHTLLSPGDNIIVISPAYQSLYEIAYSLGCNITRWELNIGKNGWQIDLNLLEQDVKDLRPKMIVINFPHNPTGFLPSISEFEAIINIARKSGVYIFSDEMYRFLEYDADERLPSACDLYEKGISLSGLSKSFALPGLRLGWLATQDHALVEKWISFKDYTTICNNAPSEILGIIALRAREKILRRNIDIIQTNIAFADLFFIKNKQQFEWHCPKAGSVGFPKWIGKELITTLCKELIDQKGIMIVPGSMFDYPGNHFRIGLGRRNLGEILDQLDNYLKDRLN